MYNSYYYLLYSLFDRNLYEKIINSSPDKISEVIKKCIRINKNFI